VSQLAHVQTEVLGLRKQPRWFLGMAKTTDSAEFTAYWSRMNAGFAASRPANADNFYIFVSPPYPATLQDIPLRDHGVTLGLDILTFPDPALLVLRLQLTSADQALSREVDPGWTNALPFLFAVYIDGKAVTLSATDGEKSGDAPYMVPLVNQGSTITWQIHLDAHSLAQMLPDAHPHSVALAAVFSNRQHEVYFGDAGPSLDSLIQPRGAQPDSQVLVRSSPVHLRWTGDRWLTPKSDEQ
jgi:hypothetical protein